ncbi:hypothetical protein JAAARDRAFT_193861 [Jaapia argillacea MUCL 33604]|uniref:Uncharacterized protein n=1 Tax=Jaapia argillacea MUCL 33604 TaxID=933084 RepID=A0A067Q4M9_9AGAM|nr:hypothetical protein JAAARDRAFT_193861 [Jaapia argillacea MUCL 33604]
MDNDDEDSEDGEDERDQGEEEVGMSEDDKEKDFEIKAGEGGIPYSIMLSGMGARLTSYGEKSGKPFEVWKCSTALLEMAQNTNLMLLWSSVPGSVTLVFGPQEEVDPHTIFIPPTRPQGPPPPSPQPLRRDQSPSLTYYCPNYHSPISSSLTLSNPSTFPLTQVPLKGPSPKLFQRWRTELRNLVTKIEQDEKVIWD